MNEIETQKPTAVMLMTQRQAKQMLKKVRKGKYICIWRDIDRQVLLKKEEEFVQAKESFVLNLTPQWSLLTTTLLVM